MISDQELKEFNEFANANPIRNKFLPILEHICKLKPKDCSIEEFGDKNDKTVSIQYHIDAGYKDPIDGRVCYDWSADINPKLKDVVIFEIWWGGECYCLLDSVIRTQNMLTVLIKKVKFESYEDQKKALRGNTFIPIPL